MNPLRKLLSRAGIVRRRRLQNASVSGGHEQLIDFRSIVERYSFAEHAARADRYFSTLDLKSPVARKPFAAPSEAAELCGGLGVLLGNLLLFPGARVLDFGAGTCWMSRILALLGCEVTAVDVSRKALEIGERLIRSDALGDQLRVDFVPLDGPDLPFADDTFDRVICFDALHHVPDQHRAIREFARVLKDGGIAALHEPGPDHSRSSQSQYEMRTHDVIEADVHVKALFESALAAGFTEAQLAVFNTQALKTDLGTFDAFLSDPAGSFAGRAFIANTAAQLENRRTFFLHKGDALGRMDSRTSSGLSAGIDLSARVDAGFTRFSGTIVNLGSSIWRPSFSGLGAVNIGIHVFGSDGRLIDQDYARFAMSAGRVASGEKRTVEIDVPHPPGVDRFEIVVDLVAEGVTWFEICGRAPPRFVVRLDGKPSVEPIT
jgi:SAM-dependent methyltransferase